jgi:hypothetical protein
MKKIPMLEKFAAQSLVEYNGELIFSKEKFAELIVKECAHLVGGYTKENEFGTDVKEAYEEITKHFGVEE